MHSSVKGFCKKARKLRYKTKKCLQRQGNDIIRIFIQGSPTTVFKEYKITRKSSWYCIMRSSEEVFFIIHELEKGNFKQILQKQRRVSSICIQAK